MINQLVGMSIKKAEEMLKLQNIKYHIVSYNDKKMNSWDKTLVLRAGWDGDTIKLVATNFLFSPEQKV